MLSFGGQRDTLKREVRNQVDGMMNRQFSLFSEIFGKPLKRDLFSKDRIKLRRKAERWIDSAFDTFGANWNTLSVVEKRERLGLFLDKAFRMFAKVPRKQHALLWYKEQMEDALTLRESSLFAASYNRYSKAIGWLVRDLFKMNRINIAQECFAKFAKSEDGFSLAQLFAQQLLPAYGSLDRLQTRHLDSRDIHKLAKLYLTYSGAFEKIARMLVVLNRIRGPEIVDYVSLTKKSMAELQKEIQKEPRLRVLLRAFNRHIRNSVAHHSYSVNVSTKKVTFDDRAKLVSMTWHRFRQETSGLSFLVIAISVTPFLHFFLRVLVSLEKAIGLSRSASKKAGSI